MKVQDDGLVLKGPLGLILLNDFPSRLKAKVAEPKSNQKKKKDKTMGRRGQFARRLAFGFVLPMFLLKNPNAEHFENLLIIFQMGKDRGSKTRHPPRSLQ